MQPMGEATKSRSIKRALGLSAGYVVCLLLATILLVLPAAPFFFRSGTPTLADDVISAIATSVGALFVTHLFLRMDGASLRDAGLAVKPADGIDLLLGSGLGLLMFLVVAMVPILVGRAQVHIGRNLFSVPTVILWIAFFVVQSMGEEVICRGYLLRIWTRSINLPAGLIISSTMFAAGHLANAGFNALAFLNTVLSGILLGVVYARSGSLWLVAGIHVGWNTAQPLLGVPLSGRAIRITPLEIHYNGGIVWSGGQYGLEASLPAAAVLLLLCMVAAYAKWPPRREDRGIWHPLPGTISGAVEIAKPVN